MPTADQLHRSPDESHRGGRVPARSPAAAAHAKRLLQKPQDSRDPGQGQLVRSGRTARRGPGNREDPEGEDLHNTEKRGTLAHPLIHRGPSRFNVN